MASYLPAGRGGPARPGTDWAGETRLPPPPRGGEPGRQAGSGELLPGGGGRRCSRRCRRGLGAPRAAARIPRVLRESPPLAPQTLGRAEPGTAAASPPRCRLLLPLLPLLLLPLSFLLLLFLLSLQARTATRPPLPCSPSTVQTQCERRTQRLPQGRGPCDPHGDSRQRRHPCFPKASASPAGLLGGNQSRGPANLARTGRGGKGRLCLA